MSSNLRVNELWKPIDGYEGIYEISNLGSVRSLDRYKKHNTSKLGKVLIQGVMLKQATSHKGYRITYLSKNGKQKTVPVHRLVAFAFIPAIKSKPQVNHIDGNKFNNTVDNLEWCDNSENQIHAYKLGLNHTSENAGRKKRPILQIDFSTKTVIAKYKSVAEAVKLCGANSSDIIAVCNKQRNTHKGFIWQFEEGDLK